MNGDLPVPEPPRSPHCHRYGQPAAAVDKLHNQRSVVWLPFVGMAILAQPVRWGCIGLSSTLEKVELAESTRVLCTAAEVPGTDFLQVRTHLRGGGTGSSERAPFMCRGPWFLRAACSRSTSIRRGCTLTSRAGRQVTQ